jgi:hypothetical protein
VHIIRNTCFILFSALFALSLGCITKVEERGSASSNPNTVTISATADAGATISPSSISANIGDRPEFAITLKSGYKIDTVLCWVGGALTRNDDGTYKFKMAPVDRSETVSVRTLRSSGIAVLMDESQFDAIPGENGTLRFLGTGTALDQADIVLEPVYIGGDLSFAYRVRFSALDVAVNDSRVSVSRQISLGYTDVMIPVNHTEATVVSIFVDGVTQTISLRF